MAQKRGGFHTNQQPSLFDRTSTQLPTAKTTELATLLELLLAEIAAALAKREAGNEQDHR